MEARRDAYLRQVREPFYAFIQAMAPGMLDIDPQIETRPGKCLSRIYRDTRFTKDKAPYRDHHWVAFRRVGEPREGSLFFWFEIRIEQASWGLGLWGENKELLDRFRAAMLAQPDELLRHLPALEAREISLEGTLYKRLPLPSTLDPRLIPWYPRRELYLQRTETDQDNLFKNDIVDRVLDDFALLAPIYRNLRGESRGTEGEERI